jgi:hypothetical protein
MRPNQNKNRQRNRNGGRKHVNPLSRNFESNGPDVKVRGNAAHVAEKYMQLARDAQSSGDSVMAENYLQHAEHYFRIVSSAQQALNGQRDGQDDGDFDDDMPEMNSRFSSPQPAQPQNGQGENDDGEGGDGQQARSQQGEQRPRDAQDGERAGRNERRDRQRGRERFRPDGQSEQPQVQQAGGNEQPAVEAAEAVVEQPTPEGEGDMPKPRERRPRRRRPAGGDAGEAAGGDEGSPGELPAFLTAGNNAAE